MPSQGRGAAKRQGETERLKKKWSGREKRPYYCVSGGGKGKAGKRALERAGGGGVSLHGNKRAESVGELMDVGIYPEFDVFKLEKNWQVHPKDKCPLGGGDEFR